jgi:phage-related protein
MLNYFRNIKKMSKVVKSVAKGTEDRVSGTIKSVFGTVGRVLGRARNAAVGTVGVAKDIVTLDGKNLKKDAEKVGRSAVGVVTNVADGAVKTARVAITGKSSSKSRIVSKKTKSSKK